MTAGLRHAHVSANADVHAPIVAVQANLASAERYREVEIAVVVVVAPGIGERVRDAE
ncbi:MAG: hypothetical protein M3431_10055 [Actinomycetota bacterium]|nr:hypothetical protein [Actinomycetota bacterium]